MSHFVKTIEALQVKAAEAHLEERTQLAAKARLERETAEIERDAARERLKHQREVFGAKVTGSVN